MEELCKISSGLICHAALYGFSDSDLATRAPAPIFKPPGSIEEVKEPRIALKHHFYSSNLQQSRDEVKRLIGTRWGLFRCINSDIVSMNVNFFGKSQIETVSTSDGKSEESYFTQLDIYPVGAFKVPCNELLLSNEAKNCIREIASHVEAENFLHLFGSHYPSGIHHYGGMVCRRWKAECKSKNSGVKMRAEEASFVYGPSEARSEAEFFGAIEKSPGKGVVYDRGESKLLVPVWKFFGAEFSNEAKLVRSTWIEITKKCGIYDICKLRDTYFNDISNDAPLLGDLWKKQKENTFNLSTIIELEENGEIINYLEST